MKLLQLYLAILASLLLTSCFKDPIFKPVEPKLPDTTQQGLNTFGCYKNGELWLPGPMGGEGFFTPYLFSSYSSISNELMIDVSDRIDFLYIRLSGNISERKILLTDSMNYADCLSYDTVNNTSCFLRNSISDSSFVRITKFDTANQIVSGVFQFFFPDSCGIANSFTEGRFDLKYSEN